jgi:pyruvate formate lyase activating enzyme
MAAHPRVTTSPAACAPSLPGALPCLVDVKRGSESDGPGLRSVVFFKGCPLRCVFCHNPETQDAKPEIAFNPRACIDCRRCLAVCPTGTIDQIHQNRTRPSRCKRCGACAGECPSGALRIIGRTYQVDELLSLLLRDEPFYRHSGGGVTFSGGECTLYPDYLAAIGTRLKAAGIHVAIQTSGMFAWRTFRERILPWVDLVFYDLKIVDPDVCRRVTGASSRTVLDNLIRLLEAKVVVQPTVPLIPGITATPSNLSDLVAFLQQVGAPNIAPRPWNPLGIESYRQLGRVYPGPDLPERFLTPDEERRLLDLLRATMSELDARQLRQGSKSPVQA